MKILLNTIRVRSWVRYAGTTLLVVMLLLGSSWSPADAAATVVVGDGTQESCTLDALNQAIAAAPVGGMITFNCGSDPVTIWIADVYIEKDLTIDGEGLVIFTGGSSGGDGFNIFAGATVRFMNFTFTEGTGSCSGPIYNSGTLTLHNITLANNSSSHACEGAAIGNYGILRIENSVITGNSTDCDAYGDCGLGGGIGNYGTLRVINSTISSNNGQGGGGGIYNLGTATIENSTLSENFTRCQIEYNDETGEPYQVCNPGGGILNVGTLTLINSTVSGNSTGNASGGSGGGIANYGTLFLQNTTIAHNTAFAGGGLANENVATLQNTILAGNTDGNNQPSDCNGTFTSQGYNLFGSTNGCTITGDSTGNLLNVNPMLGPLQDNGGPTFTHTLLPGSAAIDAGNPAAPGSGTACEATDQRGVPRPQDGNNDGIARCDIGAVEVQPSFQTVTIDIKPGDNTNPLNLKSKGLIPVAILSTSTFDATTVDPSSVTFGPSGAKSVSSSLEDVNGDGQLDLVLHFHTQQSGLNPGDTQACLTGQTQGGTAVQGCDSIHIVP